jgi:hypothetical protein
LAVALISLAGLALEVELTRLFSVLYFPPAVFAILSLAILGIGLGAALVTWRERWQDVAHLPLYLLFAVAGIAGIVAAAVIPPLQPLLLALVILPYLFVGMSLTAIFSARAQESGRLYMADLLGAGAGALAAVALLNWLGGLNALLSTALILALAGLLLTRGSLLRYALAASALAALLVGNLLFNWLAVDMGRLPVEKPIAATLAASAGGCAASGSVVDTEWDAFARSDLVDPGESGPYRLYIDGAAGSVMPPVEDNAFLWDDIGLFPFATEQPGRVFLIGPGGGLDVWFALQSGAE